MSNSAIRGEDEAVLESIRRLVSATPHHDRRAPELPHARPQEKLLLTPSLRVEEPAAEPEPMPDPLFARREAAWSLEDRIAELEAAVGARPDDWEPDGSEDVTQETPDRFVFQHRPLPLSGREVEPVILRAFREEDDDLEDREDKASESETGGLDISADDALPDADALRDLVAEIVRQELQGELGQKVTRNIRKLVRREIRRALASRDFD